MFLDTSQSVNQSVNLYFNDFVARAGSTHTMAGDSCSRGILTWCPFSSAEGRARHLRCRPRVRVSGAEAPKEPDWLRELWPWGGDKKYNAHDRGFLRFHMPSFEWSLLACDF